MGWIGPAIMAGGAIASYFGNKKKEKKAQGDARKAYDQRYNSPLARAYQGYLRNYYNEHHLADRLPGVNLDELLAPPAFDASRYKTPGAGGHLAGGILDALAAHYGVNTGGAGARATAVNGRANLSPFQTPTPPSQGMPMLPGGSPQHADVSPSDAGVDVGSDSTDQPDITGNTTKALDRLSCPPGYYFNPAGALHGSGGGQCVPFHDDHGAL